MKIFMTGGTGFVGSGMVRALAAEGHEVTVLTRSVAEDRVVPGGVSLLEGNPAEEGPWQEAVGTHEVIINLAGASIFTRWTDGVKRRIRDSRILTTRNLSRALSSRKGKETLFLSTSAVGYYGFHGDEVLEEAGSPGHDFLAELAKDWEAAALEAEAHGARVVLCRFGIVLGRRGGALGQMLPLFKRYLGSPLGDGKQWFSWVHERDLANIFLFLLRHKELEGPINCTAPYPVRNKEMTKILGDVLEKPTFLPPVPRFVLKIIQGEFATVLVKGQKVIPKKLVDSSYQFEFPALKEALEDILK